MILDVHLPWWWRIYLTACAWSLVIADAFWFPVDYDEAVERAAATVMRHSRFGIRQ